MSRTAPQKQTVVERINKAPLTFHLAEYLMHGYSCLLSVAFVALFFFVVVGCGEEIFALIQQWCFETK